MFDALVKFFVARGDSAQNLWIGTKQVMSFIGDTISSLWNALLQPKKVRWREVFYYMDSCGREALGIVSVICMMIGLILAFQAGVQMHPLGMDIYIADMVGFAVLKELGPLMVAIICTGRAGSSFAAELGTMKVNEEIDAMTTMGFSAGRFLVVPKILALVVVMPLLTMVGNIFGLLGGMLVAHMNFGVSFSVYYNRTVQVLGPIHLCEGLVKSVIFAFLVAAVGCLRGLQSSADAQGVGRSATSAVVSGIFLVILSDVFLTMIFSV